MVFGVGLSCCAGLVLSSLGQVGSPWAGLGWFGSAELGQAGWSAVDEHSR